MPPYVLRLPFQPWLGIYPLPQFLIHRQQRPLNLTMIPATGPGKHAPLHPVALEYGARELVDSAIAQAELQRYYDFSLKTE